MGKIVSFLVLAPLVLGACSCSTEAAMQSLTGSSGSSPVFLGCKTEAEGVRFVFSGPVSLASAYFDPATEFTCGEDGDSLVFYFEGPGSGEKVTADILVEDSRGNTLNVLVPFRTRNRRVPALAISEIRTEYSKPKVEFVELRILGEGNLAALRLYAASTSADEPIYEFPPLEVAAGDFVVVHARSLDTETGICDEVNGSRTESAGTDCTAAWDLWMPGSSEIIRKSDAVYITDQDDKVLDGVVFVESSAAYNTKLSAAAKMMHKQGAWDGTAAESAFSSSGTTATKTINRDNSAPDTNGAADWYICATSKASPGTANAARP